MPLFFIRPLRGLGAVALADPPLKRRAIVIRPLRGLGVVALADLPLKTAGECRSSPCGDSSAFAT